MLYIVFCFLSSYLPKIDLLTINLLLWFGSVLQKIAFSSSVDIPVRLSLLSILHSYTLIIRFHGCFASKLHLCSLSIQSHIYQGHRAYIMKRRLAEVIILRDFASVAVKITQSLSIKMGPLPLY